MAKNWKDQIIINNIIRININPYNYNQDKIPVNVQIYSFNDRHTADITQDWQDNLFRSKQKSPRRH